MPWITFYSLKGGSIHTSNNLSFHFYIFEGSGVVKSEHLESHVYISQTRLGPVTYSLHGFLSLPEKWGFLT